MQLVTIAQPFNWCRSVLELPPIQPLRFLYQCVDLLENDKDDIIVPMEHNGEWDTTNEYCEMRNAISSAFVARFVLSFLCIFMNLVDKGNARLEVNLRILIRFFYFCQFSTNAICLVERKLIFIRSYCDEWWVNAASHFAFLFLHTLGSFEQIHQTTIFNFRCILFIRIRKTLGK